MSRARSGGGAPRAPGAGRKGAGGRARSTRPAEPGPSRAEGAGASVLGVDPFEAHLGPDPFLERLDALRRTASPLPPARELRLAPARRAGSAATAAPQPAPRSINGIEDALPPARPRPARIPRAPAQKAPPAADAEPPPVPRGRLERWLGADVRRRLAVLDELVEAPGVYDPFGLSPAAARAAFPYCYALYRYWFRVESRGHEHLPAAGRAVLAGNHGGLLPFDAVMTIVDLLLRAEPPRLARAIVERWAGTLPFVNVFYARVGQVVGTRENFAALLERDALVLVYPEGVEGIRKPITQRYRLQRFHVGFVEQALLAGAPIVPVATLGSDDQAPILYDARSLARWLGLPVAPVTPTFPWLGPLGLLPYPVRYRIVYGEPLRFHEQYGPEGARDARLVRYLASRVRREVQRLVDRNR